MSDFIPIPYQPGTPEYDEYVRGQTRALTIPLSHAVSGLTSLATLPGQDVAPSTTESYVPGLVSRIGGGILGTADAADKVLDALTAKPEAYIRDKLGLPPRGFNVEPTKPWVTRLEDLGESSRKGAEAFVHPVQPENDTEQLLADIGDQAGLMAVPLPGRAVTMLPKVMQKALSPALHILTPLATEHKVAPFVLGTGLLTAQEAAAQAANPSADNPNQAPSPPTSPPPQPPTPQAQAQTPLPTPPIPPPTAPPPAPTQSNFQFSMPGATQPSAGGFQFQMPAQDSNAQGDTPAQSQTGDTGITPAEMVAGGAALLLPFAGIRYGRRFLERGGLAGPADTSAGTPYAQQTQEFRNFQMNPDWSAGKTPAAPLSVAPAQATAARVQGAVQDETALLRTHIANSDASNADLAHAIGDVKNQSAQQARVTSYMETGYHPASGVQTVSPQEVLLNHGRLSDTQKGVVDDALHAANEMDNRVKLFNQAVGQGGPVNPLDTRVAFRQNDDADLRNKIAAGLADPDTARVLNGVWGLGRSNLDIMRAMDYPTADINRIGVDHPHYIPTMNADGTPMHIFDAREITPNSGALRPPGPAIDAFMQHQDSLLKRIENDALNRKIIDGDKTAQINDPNHAAMFTQKTTPSGDFTSGRSEPSVVIPRSTGWETHTINNPEIEQAMKASPTMKRGILQAMRNFFTQYTTGPGALVAAGKFFPAIHGLTRGPYLQNLNTPSNMYASLADRLYKRAGGAGSIRASPDPWAGAPAMVAKTLYDRSGHAASNMLMPDAPNPFNKMLRSQFGDASIDALRQRLVDNYKKSLTFRWRSGGGSNVGIYGRMQIPAYQRTGKGVVVNNPAATLAPRAVTPVSWMGRKMPFSTNVNNLVREVFDSFMEAPNLYSYALNEDNPNLTRSQLINESRAILGDPGKRGSGSVTQAAVRNLPYANATIQDLSRTVRAKSEYPISRALNRSIMLGTAAAGSIYTAMHTPGGMSHLLNLVSSGQTATGPILYNGQDTDNTTQISLPQSERGVYPFILDAMGHLSGAWDAHKDEDLFDRAYHTLGSMFSEHVSNKTLTAMGHGWAQSVDPFMQLPTLVGGVMTAMTGKEPRLQSDQILYDIMRGRMPSLATDVQGQSRTPNAVGQDSLLGSSEGKRWEHALSAIFGLGSNLLETGDRAYTAFKHGTSPVDAALDNMWQHLKDQNQSFNNILWPNATRIAADTPLVEQTNKALDVMRDAVGAKSDIVNQGFTRKGGVPVSGQAEQKTAPDPTVQHMRLVVAGAMNLIDHKYMPHITDLKKLDADLGNSTMDEDTRRQKHNEYMREINAGYIPIAETVARINEQLSHMSGKKIDIAGNPIDWKRGADQFN